MNNFYGRVILWFTIDLSNIFFWYFLFKYYSFSQHLFSSHFHGQLFLLLCTKLSFGWVMSLMLSLMEQVCWEDHWVLVRILHVCWNKTQWECALSMVTCSCAVDTGGHGNIVVITCRWLFSHKYSLSGHCRTHRYSARVKTQAAHLQDMILSYLCFCVLYSSNSLLRNNSDSLYGNDEIISVCI